MKCTGVIRSLAKKGDNISLCLNKTIVVSKLLFEVFVLEYLYLEQVILPKKQLRHLNGTRVPTC